MSRVAGILRPVVLALALLPAGGCGGCGSKPGGADGGSAEEALKPLPPPAGHLADLYVANPGATWTKARAALGQPALFLPQSFGALATTLIGLPITQSAEIDEAVPVVGAFVRIGRGPVQGAIGVHVKAGDRFVDQVTRGDSARFNATVDPATHVTLLTDKIAPASMRVSLGVLGNYLIVAQKPADLYAVGPYVVRTLGAAPVPKDDVVLDVPEKALAGPILDEVRALGDDMKGVALSILPVTGLLDTTSALLGDAQGARFVLNLDGDAIRGKGTLTPKAGGGPGSKIVEELAVGDVKPLLELPDATSAALLWRLSPATRAENAPKEADALAHLLGGDVSAEDKAAITAALRAEAAAHGEWQTMGVAFNGTGPTAVVRAPVTDADAMRKALKQLVELAAIPSFKKTLAGLGGKLVTEKVVVENIAADVTRIRFQRADDKDASAKVDPKKESKPKTEKVKAPGETPKALDLLYFVDKDGLFAAAGYDPKDSLRALVKAPAGPNLGASQPVTSALSPIGAEAACVLVADVLRINAMTTGAMAPATPAPVVLAAGRSGPPAQLWGRIDVPLRVVQEVIADLMRRRTSGSGAP
jgi:hypothetical protein